MQAFPLHIPGHANYETPDHDVSCGQRMQAVTAGSGPGSDTISGGPRILCCS